ncbi:barstar family protein [Paenibacillus polysaccharolyticus]|uniref:barstar family protein n=1 Tax=Paenibacillus polysaccharolyticus TaxID=582692 RepID=UPI00203FF792|nr:barstar family protein [Paenibacillus polysaccharolyticus]MCM3132998.1 barstar family protein [Paenibacillus polysaccharolyticus]
MKKVIIDGKNIGSIEELQRTLRTEFSLQPAHFESIDTLWEGLVWHVPVPVTLEWHHFSESRAAIGPYADQLMNLLYEVDEQLEELFRFVLKL